MDFMTSKRPAFKRAAIWVILPLVVYLLAAVIITWPLVKNIKTRAAGAGYGDSYEVIRHAWWTREAVLHGHNPFKQTLLTYPNGFTSALQWTHPFQYVAPALLSLVASPLAAFNLVLLLVLAANGTTAYWLGMTFSGRNIPAALLGGLVFLAFPTMQGHLNVGHLGILALFPLPLFALCLWRIVYEGAGWRTAAWGGVWFALTALSYVSQIIFLLFPLLLFFGGSVLIGQRERLFRPGVPWRDQLWIKGIAMVVFGGALLLPFYLPLIAAGGSEVGAITETGRITYSADLLAFVSPSPLGVFKHVVPDYARDVVGTNSAEGSAYLGIVAVSLAAVALARRKGMRVWLVVALGSMLFSLGPLLKWRDKPVTLTIEGTKTHITLPWAALEALPLIDATRTPGRFNLVTGLALSALVSAGAAVIFARVRRWEIQAGLAAVLGVLIGLEYQVFAPFATDNAAQPHYFRDLAAQKDVRAVLNVPIDDNLVAKFGLYQQTFHHKPLIAGHVLRRTPQDPALLAILDRAAAPDASDSLPALRPEDVPYLLSQAGADRVVVFKQVYADPAAVVQRLGSILGAPDYEDDRYAVFAVPRQAAPPPDLGLPGAASAAGWSVPVDTGAWTGSLLAGEGEWYFYADREQYGDLVFRALPYRTPRRIGVWLDGHLITGGWIGLDDPTGWRVENGAIHLPLWLAPGYHTLRLKALDGCTEYPFALTCWAKPDLSPDCAPLDPPACISAAFEPPTWEPAAAPPTPLDVSLADGLRLRAYQIIPEAAAVTVRLFWEASKPLPASYALFVHIADPATAAPAAQGTSYPFLLTTQWEPGTRWQSDVRIPLPEGFTAGTYAVNVGWFQPDSNLRLGVRGADTWARSGLVHLGTVDLGAAP